MATKRKTYVLSEDVIEVEEYHDGRYGAPGEKRQKKKKATPEQIERVNQYNREKKCRRLLRKYFTVGDYFSTWTYRRAERPPDMKTAKKHYKNAITYIRKEYRKKGYELKWIRNIEVGSKGAWHIHVVVNRIPDTDIILAKAWKHGKVKNELLYTKGEFAELAAYMTKTPKTDPRLADANYSTSRNMPQPVPKVKILKRWRKAPMPSKGFAFEGGRYHEGINPVTGYKYRHYTLVRLHRRI